MDIKLENIKSAKYRKQLGGDNNTSIDLKLVDKPTVNIAVPLDPNNNTYAKILKLVTEGKLTIEDAD